MDSERIYVELKLAKAIDTDEHGNYVVWAEASNENLDFDEQVVMQRALLDSQDYFLKNGVISYDHRHLKASPGETDWNPEKYIIGEPMEVQRQGGKTLVKAKLYRSSNLAQEIVKKLESGSTRIKTSVGGRKPQTETYWDPKLKKNIERVTSVLWDELAITPKPVNQTLEPITMTTAQFVKSEIGKALMAGSGTDSASMSGGRSLVAEDLEGSGDSEHITTVVIALTFGDVVDADGARRLLKDRGVPDDRVDEILRGVVAHKTQFGGALAMGEEMLAKSFEESISTLEKALKKGGKKGDEKPDFDGIPMPPDDEEVDDPDIVDEEKDEDDDEKGQEVKKSLMKSFQEEYDEMLDASPILEDFAKSIDSLDRRAKGQDQLLKGIAQTVVQMGRVIQQMGAQPQMRKSVVAKQERFAQGGNEEKGMTRSQVIAKSQQLVRENKLTLREASIIEDRVNKGMDPGDRFYAAIS